MSVATSFGGEWLASADFSGTSGSSSAPVRPELAEEVDKGLTCRSRASETPEAGIAARNILQKAALVGFPELLPMAMGIS